MNGNTHQHEPDVVSEAVRALRDAPMPDGPTPEQLARTAAAVRSAALASPPPTLRERIRSMPRLTKYAAAILLVLAPLAVVISVLVVGTESSVTFAAVKKQLLEARSLSFSMTTQIEGMPEQTSKAYYKMPGRMRVEMGPTVNIVNYPARQWLMLLPEGKKFMQMDISDMPGIDEIGVEDFMAELRKTLEGAVEELSEREIDGVRAKGYRVCESGMWQDIWVDAETGQPLRFETELPWSNGHVTVLEVILNPPLDDALFNMTPPTGYEEHPAPPVSRLMDATEDDLVGGLRAITTLNDGVFSKYPMMDPQLTDKLRQANMPKEELHETVQKVVRMGAYASVLPTKCTDWNYAGDGVKLGDAQTPIMWWRLKDSPTYRMLYGDLHFENVDAAKVEPTRPTGG